MKEVITMKRIYIFMCMAVSLLFTACGLAPEEQAIDAGTVELALNSTVAGSIAEPGEVDWYHFEAVEANNVLQVNCSSNTYRPDVDLLVTVYEENENGEKVRLYADHAPEGSQLPADIKMNVYIDAPKDIYIAVRDLMDDESSDDTYYLSIDFSNSSDDNDNFSQAETLSVNDPDGCQSDSINEVGDVDVFRFNAAADGVYAVNVDFSPFTGGTDVELAIDVYDSAGEMIHSLSKNQGYAYNLVHFLTAGSYYVLIDDYGRDDFDTSSPYQICIETVAAGESNDNDGMQSAADMQYDAGTGTFTVSGAIEYIGDEDWYNLPLAAISTTGFKVLELSFDDGSENTEFNYRIYVEDAAQAALLDHEYTGGSTAYETQIKAGAGDHYLMISSPGNETFSGEAPYTVSIRVLDVSDPAETVVKAEGTGNDAIDTADVLTSNTDPNAATEAFIGFRGDEDWYALTIDDTTMPQILEIFLDTDDQPSSVDYYVSIMRDSIIKKIFDANGGDGGTELKTSLLVPAVGSPVTYYFRVADYQGDDGDGTVPYRIRANINAIPVSLPPDAGITGTVVYHDEISELSDATAETIELEHNSLVQKEYRANTSHLNYNVSSPSAGIQKTQAGGLTTITFPWIAGYIDYQGDQDWYRLDFTSLIDDPAGDWFYEIRIDLHEGSPGSNVEYVWKLFRDSNSNQILVDRQNDSNGFFASAGDADTDAQAFDIMVPDGSQEFWVGDAWSGSFYVNMSDFNYVGSSHPDDDWGYDGAPYYFKVTLVYHPGESYPE
jgi:hypothetical protein